MKKQNRLIKTGRIAGIVTTLYIFAYSLLNIVGDFNDFPGMTLLAYLSVKLVFPIAVIVSWLIYADAYVVTKRKSEEKTNYPWDMLGVGMIFVLGFITLYNLLEFISYISTEWKIIDGLHVCILGKTCIFLGWVLLWMCSFMLARYIRNMGKVVKKVVVLSSFVVFICTFAYFAHIQKDYIERETESVWIQKMIEYYDENGMGPDVPPFSSV